MQNEVNEVKISGRFGNQIFQLCAALYMEKSNGKQILLDARGTRPSNLILLWKSGLIRSEELRINYYQKKFLAGAIWAKGIEIIQRLMEFGSFRIQKFIKFRLFELPYKKHLEYLDDRDWRLLLTQENEVYGYFQDWKLVEEVWCSLKIRLAASNLVDENLRLDKTALLHVRLGDYLHHTSIGILNETYYLDALKEFPYDFKFYVVTDDEVHFTKLFQLLTKKVLIDSRTHDDFETFKLLLNSTNLIVANSTFSYWAGIFSLMINQNSKVIAPKPWRNDNSKDEILSPLFHLIFRGKSFPN